MTNKYPDASILLVDDEPDIVDLFADYLEGIAPKIDRAPNGKKALELITANHYDCIVSDISMPQMSGLELLEEIRRIKKTVPFIIVTAYWDKSNAIRALRAGAFDFIEKPAKCETFVTVVSSAIEVGLSLRSLDANVQKIFDGFNSLASTKDAKVLQHQSFAHRKSDGRPKP